MATTIKPRVLPTFKGYIVDIHLEQFCRTDITHWQPLPALPEEGE